MCIATKVIKWKVNACDFVIYFILVFHKIKCTSKIEQDTALTYELLRRTEARKDTISLVY